jgi:hypothetical protein
LMSWRRPLPAASPAPQHCTAPQKRSSSDEVECAKWMHGIVLTSRVSSLLLMASSVLVGVVYQNSLSPVCGACPDWPLPLTVRQLASCFGEWVLGNELIMGQGAVLLQQPETHGGLCTFEPRAVQTASCSIPVFLIACFLVQWMIAIQHAIAIMRQVCCDCVSNLLPR